MNTTKEFIKYFQNLLRTTFHELVTYNLDELDNPQGIVNGKIILEIRIFM